jgi:hypothetical protein
MSVTAPPPITPLPQMPSTDDPDNFDPEADAALAALQPFADQVSAVGLNTYNNAVDAASNAIVAQQAAATAQAGADAVAVATGAVQFVAATAYAQYALVFSLIDGASYRRRTAGTSTLDPSKDYRGATANWWRVSGVSRSRVTAASFYN